MGCFARTYWLKDYCLNPDTAHKMIQSFENAMILDLPSEKQEGIISFLVFGRGRSALMRLETV